MKYVWVLVILIGVVLLIKAMYPKVSEVRNGVVISSYPTLTPTLEMKNGLAEPVAEFKKRITKKFFGTYVTPQNSPVKPERFTGYHTGVDVEYGDVSGQVKVMAIDSGKVIMAGPVGGYGQVVVIQHQRYLSLYGHVVPSVKVGQVVAKGEKIAILGKAYSSETGGERKHLHLGIINGLKIDYRGYVQNYNELSGWINPMDLF